MTYPAYRERLVSITKNSQGLTLIELVIVIAIIGAAVALIPTLPFSRFKYWQYEGTIRRLSETITFLHTQSVSDRAFYRMEFNMDQDNGSFRVGEIVPEQVDYEENTNIKELGSDAGILTTELAVFLNPSLGAYQNMIVPRSMPSLGEAVELPYGMYFQDIRTMRGVAESCQDCSDEEKPYIIFSPRGFSEFAVIHVKTEAGAEKTILVNPFTGLTQIYNEYRDFEWTYGQNKK